MSTSCDIPLPPGLVCSSNGICLNNTCLCNTPGFSSIGGDLRFKAGLDCDIYLPAITALWSLVIFFGGIAICSSAYQLIQEFRKSRRRNDKLLIHKAYMQIHIGIVISGTLWGGLGIWRISDVENTAIGSSVGTSYFQIFIGCYFTAFALFLLYRFYTIHSAFLQNHLEKKRKFQKILVFLYFVSFIFPWFMVLWGLYQPQDADVCVQVRFIIDGLNNFCYAILAPISLTPLIRALDESIAARTKKTKEFQKLRSNLNFVRRELIVQPTFGGTLKLIFAFWPYMRRKVVYEFPIQIVLWMIITMSVSFLIMKKSQEDKTMTISDQNETASPNVQTLKLKEQGSLQTFSGSPLLNN